MRWISPAAALALAACAAAPPPAGDAPAAATTQAGTMSAGPARDTPDCVVPVSGVETRFARTPPPYADEAPWFRNGPVIFREKKYLAYGEVRVVHPTPLAQVGEYRGVRVFAEAADASTPDVVYMAVSPGCALQPFYHFDESGRVRG